MQGQEKFPDHPGPLPPGRLRNMIQMRVDEVKTGAPARFPETARRWPCGERPSPSSCCGAPGASRTARTRCSPPPESGPPDRKWWDTGRWGPPGDAPLMAGSRSDAAPDSRSWGTVPSWVPNRSGRWLRMTSTTRSFRNSHSLGPSRGVANRRLNVMRRMGALNQTPPATAAGKTGPGKSAKNSASVMEARKSRTISAGRRDSR